MKIYTKAGDDGKTSLIGGKRVSKSNAKIWAYGSLDELNAQVGLLNVQIKIEKTNHQLLLIQNQLFNMGSILASNSENIPDFVPKMHKKMIQDLESWIDEMNVELPPLRNFVLPGGTVVIAQCHVVRTVCRRVERYVVGLSELDAVDSLIIKYLNRLSDYFFILSRYLAIYLDVKEVIWTPNE